MFRTYCESALPNVEFVVRLRKSAMTESSDLAIRDTVLPIHIIMTIIIDDGNNVIGIILVRVGSL